MKRLSGGLILLNLCNISLDVTAGEVSITDSEILEQLTELRQFIDVQRDFSKGFKSLKPVLIEYRSSASKFNGVVQGNLSFDTDALHMSIGGMSTQKDGKLLTIAIKVEYEYVDFKGYQVKTAKINAYERVYQSGAEFDGDVEIDGDLDVIGDAKLFENIVDANGYNRFVSLPTSVSSGIQNITHYAKATLSGTHLMLVLAFDVTTGVVIGGDYSDLMVISLPNWIVDKIYGFAGGTYLTFNPALKGYTSTYYELNATIPYSINIDKINKTISIRWQSTTPITFEETGSFRIAFDLLIDND